MADENKKANYAGIELWKLSVPELEKLLYSGSHLPDDGADEDFYDALEEVLLRKEQENPSGRLPDPSKAWPAAAMHFLQRKNPHRRAPPTGVATSTNSSNTLRLQLLF